jgi:hypothetical protein
MPPMISVAMFMLPRRLTATSCPSLSPHLANHKARSDVTASSSNAVFVEPQALVDGLSEK